MNRKMRLELRKDKNLIKELYSIIIKYLLDLLNLFDNLTDNRNQSYVTYNMKTICVTRLFELLCGLTSMTDISSDKFNSDSCIKNLSKICNQNLNELPYWETIQDVFINIQTDQLRNIQKYIVKALIRSKMFDKYKYNGYFQLVVDGTGLSNHNYSLNNNCLKGKHKDGRISYYKYVLECKLIVGSIVISVDSEWIENDTSLLQKEKQDCEIKAFERMAKRIKKNYPKYKFIITADALYCTAPMMNICKNYNWKYIFNLNDRLRTVFKDFLDYIECFNDTIMKNHYFFIQFAHTIRQLLEQGNILTKSLRLKIKEVSEFLLHTLTSTTSDLNNIEINFQLRFDT